MVKTTASRGSSSLVCGNCGGVSGVFRLGNQSREVGHVKDLYCIRCEAKMPFIEHVLSSEAELFWVLQERLTSSEVPYNIRVYDPSTEKVLGQDAQHMLLGKVYNDLGADLNDIDLAEVMEHIKKLGYKPHVIKYFKKTTRR